MYSSLQKLYHIYQMATQTCMTLYSKEMAASVQICMCEYVCVYNHDMAWEQVVCRTASPWLYLSTPSSHQAKYLMDTVYYGASSVVILEHYVTCSIMLLGEMPPRNYSQQPWENRDHTKCYIYIECWPILLQSLYLYLIVFNGCLQICL